MAEKKTVSKTNTKNTQQRSKKVVEDVEENQNENNYSGQTRPIIFGIFSILFGVLFTLGMLGSAGPAGAGLEKGAQFLFGYGAFLLPITLLGIGINLIKKKPIFSHIPQTLGVLFIGLSALGLLHIISPNSRSGGVIGYIIGAPLKKLFETAASSLILFVIFIAGCVLVFDNHPTLKSFWLNLQNRFLNFFKKKNDSNIVSEIDYEEDLLDEEETENDDQEEPEIINPKKFIEKKKDEIEDIVLTENKKPHRSTGGYTPPPLSLLEADRGRAQVGDIKANANIIRRTLMDFGIEVEMDEITIGPTFTRYALKPAQGVKVSRITGLQNDLALALAAHPVRVEAPIPGKSLVGIEIPNKTKATVSISTLMADERFKKSPKPLFVALGRDVSGNPHYMDLAKAPHALIAGTTGSGKSVTIHSIVSSLIYRNGPDDMKFIMVDPKRVELTLYNNIPHLLTPVITDAKKAILALKWAAKEMERRYDILQSESVRDIQSYHQNIVKNMGSSGDIDRMPYIVVIIDELADIMQAYPRELEAAIVRLAQMSRAVGIHLVLSTQRPEVNVITGLIKANVPTRIALRVPTQVDSRTILDTAGAEKLLGSGDMLYSSGEGQPHRLQSSYISEDEVKKVAKYLREQYKDELNEQIELTGTPTADKSIFESVLNDEKSSNDDELYEEARQIVIESGKASTSFLQRKLGIGYARAARLIDILEERGIVGPGNGAKPREVLEKPIERDEAGQNL